MRQPICLLALAAALLTPPAPPAAVPACPSTATLDQLIKAIDSAITGPANRDRTCFRALFLPDARLIPIRIAADGTPTPRILTVQDWIDADVYKRQTPNRPACSTHQNPVHKFIRYYRAPCPFDQSILHRRNQPKSLYLAVRSSVVM